MQEIQTTFKNALSFAKDLDHQDELAKYRDQFYIPLNKSDQPYIYFTGNSLGLQPKSTRAYVEQELLDWEKLGVEGHFRGKTPWMPYHEFLTKQMANVVGAKEIEVVTMNTLTVNLHLMMVSFYQPTANRNKILIEYDAFPSDKYAVQSQLKFHGYDPKESLIQLKAKDGEYAIREEDILDVIDKEGDQIALIMLGGVNYYTGQVFDYHKITKWAQTKGCNIGFDFAHGAGNLDLKLNESQMDFAVWCSYKYLNSGPGSLGGCFVHEKHQHNEKLNRFSGWWGHNKDTRFKMRDEFDPMPGAEGWQLSNPPILPMAAMRSSLDIFNEVGMEKLNIKSKQLTAYLDFLMNNIDDERINIITPESRGCQLSIQIKSAGKSVFGKLLDHNIIADWREPDVIRVAPVPLYNTYEEVYQFADIIKNLLGNER